MRRGEEQRVGEGRKEKRGEEKKRRMELGKGMKRERKGEGMMWKGVAGGIGTRMSKGRGEIEENKKEEER